MKKRRLLMICSAVIVSLSFGSSCFAAESSNKDVKKVKPPTPALSDEEVALTTKIEIMDGLVRDIRENLSAIRAERKKLLSDIKETTEKKLAAEAEVGLQLGDKERKALLDKEIAQFNSRIQELSQKHAVRDKDVELLTETLGRASEELERQRSKYDVYSVLRKGEKVTKGDPVQEGALKALIEKAARYLPDHPAQAVAAESTGKDKYAKLIASMDKNGKKVSSSIFGDLLVGNTQEDQIIVLGVDQKNTGKIETALKSSIIESRTTGSYVFYVLDKKSLETSGYSWLSALRAANTTH